MPIQFRCTHCGQLLSISRKKAGSEVTCPQCVHRTAVPNLEPTVAAPVSARDDESGMRLAIVQPKAAESIAPPEKDAWKKHPNPWLQEELDGRDRLCLDPADSSHGPPGRLALIRGETVVAWRFYGGLSPRRSPHILVRAAATLLPEIREEGVVQLFPVTASPLIQQLARCIIELARPTQILMASGTPLPLSPWPAPVEEVECEPALPGAVAASKRRARWRQWFSECEVHSISMFQVTLEGVRLGSGRALNAVELEQAGLSRALRAEIQGGKLWIVGDETFDAETIARVAKDQHADAIIVTTRGMGLARRLILGSVTDKVIRSAKLPVFIIPAAAAEEA